MGYTKHFNGEAIVMVGSLSDGWKPVGPFDDWEAACSWADENDNGNPSWVMTLQPPEVDDDHGE